MSDAGKQLNGIVGLGYIMICATLQSSHDCEGVSETRQQNDRDVVPLLLHLTAQLVTVDARHDDVGEHQLHMRLPQRFECGLSRARDQNLVSRILQQRRKCDRLSWTVFDDEDRLPISLAALGDSRHVSSIRRSGSVWRETISSTTPARTASRGIPYITEDASS